MAGYIRGREDMNVRELSNLLIVLFIICMICFAIIICIANYTDQKKQPHFKNASFGKKILLLLFGKDKEELRPFRMLG